MKEGYKLEDTIILNGKVGWVNTGDDADSSDNSSGMPNVICGFNKQMKKLCDQKITIQDTFYKNEDKFYQIKEARYCWNSQMLELPLSTLIYRRRHG